ncbi:MAG: GNAT family N-acetyltransferase [Desulfurococcales archaeon]|nr:GNAT family N-acetyltransferase [Desulfurococcales archaeon]
MAGEGAVVDRLRASEAGRVAEILRALPEWFTPNAAVEAGRDAASMTGFAARLGGVVRGFVLVDVRECCVEIAWLAVERGFQGRGLGSLLLEAAEDYACSRGKHVLAVKTYGGMDYEPYMRTLRFYGSRGFKLYGVIDEYKPFGGQPAAILIKRLDCGQPPGSARGAPERPRSQAPQAWFPGWLLDLNGLLRILLRLGNRRGVSFMYSRYLSPQYSMSSPSSTLAKATHAGTSAAATRSPAGLARVRAIAAWASITSM